MNTRKIIGLAGIVTAVLCFVAFRLSASSNRDGVTTTLPNGLVVTAIHSPKGDLPLKLFGGAVYQFHIGNPESRRVLNVYVETLDKNLKSTVAAGLGVAPIVGQPGKPDVDCTIAIMPLGNSLMDSEKIKVTVLIDGTSSVSPIVNNPFLRKNQSGTPGNFSAFGDGVYNPNGSWTLVACGEHGITTGPKLNDLTMVVRFDTSPPITIK